MTSRSPFTIGIVVRIDPPARYTGKPFDRLRGIYGIVTREIAGLSDMRVLIPELGGTYSLEPSWLTAVASSALPPAAG